LVTEEEESPPPGEEPKPKEHHNPPNLTIFLLVRHLIAIPRPAPPMATKTVVRNPSFVDP
jgi:hypothetical protein